MVDRGEWNMYRNVRHIAHAFLGDEFELHKEFQRCALVDQVVRVAIRDIVAQLILKETAGMELDGRARIMEWLLELIGDDQVQDHMVLDDVAADQTVKLHEWFVFEPVLGLTTQDLKVGELDGNTFVLDEIFGED